VSLQLVQKHGDGNFGHPEGHPGGFLIPNHEVLFTQWDKVLEKLGPGPWRNLYVTQAHHLLEEGKGYTRPQRTAQTFLYQVPLTFDIDHCDVTRGLEYGACVAKVLQVQPIDLTMVNTGHGVHIYANLKNPIRSVKYMTERKPAFNELCRLIEIEILARGLPLDKKIGGKVDPVIFEPARILRVPGTINAKEGLPEVDCILLQFSPVSHDLDMMVLSGLDKIEKENVSPEQIRRQFPKPDLQEMVKECLFIREVMEKPETVHEPQAFALIGLMAAQDPTSTVEHKGKAMTGREVAQEVYASASNSPSCAGTDFDRKWEAASHYGAQKCSTINDHWGGCDACPHRSKIPTPLALKGPDFVGSEKLGYWVISQKGILIHPHYEDLGKVYRQETSCIVTEGDRLFSFENSHFIPRTDLAVKAWMEKKVTPTEALREAHRVELVKKVKVMSTISKNAEDDLFVRSIRGKLNAANGVIDIIRGQKLPHSPSHGFQYVLPYDYVAGQASEIFLEWLCLITQDRVELMDAILDMMAYCLWPTYDDHVFFCLIGVGANGKSTLIHIIQEMLGRQNFSAVSMQQLGSNRFAPANLEGKLANLSEESSGYELNFEELNVLQNLSAGGEMEVERKGVQGFTFRNRAKLIFSANRPPRFKDTGHAIRRRMVVIPFDYLIKRPDSNIERDLIKEVPAIVSMLIRRIQKNIAKNEGAFRVARGGDASLEAQKNILLAGNSVVEWSKDHVESNGDIPDDSYIEISESYKRYKIWCDENTYRAVNVGMYSSMMYNFVISSTVRQSDNRVRVAGKQIRVFRRTRWREEL
jgi:P4 family phage/plasmid primase-like protien